MTFVSLVPFGSNGLEEVVWNATGKAGSNNSQADSENSILIPSVRGPKVGVDFAPQGSKTTMKNKSIKLAGLAPIPEQIVDHNKSPGVLPETEVAGVKMLWQRTEIRRRVRNMIRVLVRYIGFREELC